MPNAYANKVQVVRGGQTETLIDLTDDTAIASDVAQGKYFHLASGERVVGTEPGGGGGAVYQEQDGYLVLSDQGGGSSVTVEALNVTQNGTYTAPTGKAYSPVTVSVSGGGGGSGSMSDPIRFFDYDGTLVASYSSVPSALPSVPTHDNLTNGTWNHTLAQVTAQFNAMGTCDVGANYETASGKTEIDCEFEYGRLSPYLRISVNGTVAINWGDGSSAETVTGTSLSTAVNKQHVYPSSGSYTITIEAQQGEYRLSGTSTYTLLHANSSNANYNLCYATCIRAIRIGANASISSYAFYNCRKMKSVCIPSGVDLYSNAFGYCSELEAVVMPSRTTGTALTQLVSNCHSLKVISFSGNFVTFSDYLCSGLYVDRISLPYAAVVYSASNIIYNCYSIEHLKIRDGATQVPNSFGYGCTSLQSVSLPDSITQIGAQAFRNCYSLASVTIPQAVTSIAANAFNACQLGEIHFKPTTPPTFAANTVFGNIPTDCKIYVPTGTLSDYTSAANYPSSSTYTYIEE